MRDIQAVLGISDVSAFVLLVVVLIFSLICLLGPLEGVSGVVRFGG